MADRSLSVKLTGDTADVLSKMRLVGTDFDKLKERVERAALKLDVNDRSALAKMDDITVRMDRLSKKIARPDVDTRGFVRASAELDRLNEKIDKVDRKAADVGRGGIVGRLAGLFSGGGSGGGGGGLSAGPIGIGAAILAALALAPSTIPLALGGGVGALGAYGAYKIDKPAFAKVTKQAKSAFMSAETTGGGLTGTPAGIFAPQIGQSSFLAGILGILKQIGTFTQSIGPQLGNLFKASLPFVAAFVKVMEQAAKIIMPAMTQSLKEMTPYLPRIVQGFRSVSYGIAAFLNALGPGMKASAIIFKTGMQLIGGILHATGSAATGFALLFVKTGEGIRVVARDIPRYFDEMRSLVADTLGILKSTIVTDWNQAWADTVNIVKGGIRAVTTWFDSLPRGVQIALRGLGQMLENIGRLALSMLLSGLKAAAGPVLGFVHSLGHSIMHVFDVAIGRSSPSKAFFAAGEDIMRGLHNGIQAHESALYRKVSGVGGNVVGWITQALKVTHKPLSWLPALERLVSLESGGNPLARNPSGASGLFQTMPGTFSAYSLGGSIWNPVADAIAGIRYLSATYGSPYNIPNLFSGDYQGYAHGGVITEPIFGRGLRTGIAYGFGENGIHERVTPLGASGSGGDTYNFNVSGLIGSQDELARTIQSMLAKRKRQAGGSAIGFA